MEAQNTGSYGAPKFISTMQQATSYAEIEEVLRSPDFHQGNHLHSGPFFADTLLLSDGEAHRERRRLISTLFTKGALQYYELEALSNVIDQVMEELKQSKRSDGLVRADLTDLMKMLMGRISAVVVGMDGVNTPAKTLKVLDLVQKLALGAQVEWAVGDQEEVFKVGVEARRQLVSEFLLPALQRRQELVRRLQAGEIQKNELPEDLLTLLALHGKDVYEGDEGYIWRECSLFLLASTQTTSHAVPHVVVHLTEWMKQHPEDREKISDPEWLRRAATETLRLHQPIPSLIRLASKDLVLQSGRKVAKGERIALLFSNANREETVFGADAAEFNPYREVSQRLQPWGLTFGGGAHLCIGRTLVTGLSNRTDQTTGAEGMLVRILRALYRAGAELDPERPPVRNTKTAHDSYESMPLVFRAL